MICAMKPCSSCGKNTIHRLVTSTELCLTCGNYKDNTNPFETTLHGIRTPSGTTLHTAEEMLRYIESYGK